MRGGLTGSNPLCQELECNVSFVHMRAAMCKLSIKQEYTHARTRTRAHTCVRVCVFPCMRACKCVRANACVRPYSASADRIFPSMLRGVLVERIEPSAARWLWLLCRSWMPLCLRGGGANAAWRMWRHIAMECAVNINGAGVALVRIPTAMW